MERRPSLFFTYPDTPHNLYQKNVGHQSNDTRPCGFEYFTDSMFDNTSSGRFVIMDTTDS